MGRRYLTYVDSGRVKLKLAPTRKERRAAELVASFRQKMEDNLKANMDVRWKEELDSFVKRHPQYGAL